MARELTYDENFRSRLVQALRAGASLRDAVGFAGADWSTFCRWLRAGRRFVDSGPETEGADERFAPLARDVDRAASESKVALVGLIRRAAEGTPAKPAVPAKDGAPAQPEQPGRPPDWRAAAFLVERNDERPKRRVEVRKLRADATVAEMRAAGTLPADKHDVTSGGKPIGDLTDEELDARLAAAEQRRHGRGG